MLDNKQIDALEQLRCKVMIAQDVKALEALLDDSLIWIHGSAKQDSKASFLADFGGPVSKYLEIERSDVVIRCFGNTAVVNGVQTMRCNVEGAERNLVGRYVNVWSAHDGAPPRIVAWQTTGVSKT